MRNLITSPFVLDRIATISIPDIEGLSSAITLRKANENDDEFIEKLTKNSMASYVKESWPDEGKQDDYWALNACDQAKRDKRFKRQTYIIQNGEDPVGRITLSYLPRHWLYLALKIENCHLIGEFQSLGIFRRIFDKLVELAPDKKFFLQVLRSNSRAARLYFNNGFRLYQHPSKLKETGERFDMVYEPDEVYPPSRAFYLNKFSDILEKCRDNAVIFALFLVTFNSISPFQNVSVEARVLGLVLLVLGIIFSTYDMIAGKLYVQFKPSGISKPQGSSSWAVDRKPSMWRVFSLLFFEFAMVFFNVVAIIIPYGFLKGREPALLNGDLPSFVLFDDVHDAFLIYGLWHLSNLLWYSSSPVYLRRKLNLPPKFGWIKRKGDRIRSRDWVRHGSYFLLHTGLFVSFQYWFLGSISLNMRFFTLDASWLAITILIGLIVSTIVLQSRRYLFNDFFNLSKSLYSVNDVGRSGLPENLESKFGYKAMGIDKKTLLKIQEVRGSLN